MILHKTLFLKLLVRTTDSLQHTKGHLGTNNPDFKYKTKNNIVEGNHFYFIEKYFSQRGPAGCGMYL